MLMSLRDFLSPDKTKFSSVEDIPSSFAVFQVLTASKELFCADGGSWSQGLGEGLTLALFFGLPLGLFEVVAADLGVSTSDSLW